MCGRKGRVLYHVDFLRYPGSNVVDGIHLAYCQEITM
jgi:hypothetical protein